MDAMTVMKFWLDDSQVVHLDIVKRYTEADSGCEISIREAAE
jgi:Holliday junction resolvase RusA-like endonuclease